MDYYNLDLFDEISALELVAKSENETLIQSGNIEVYGDTVGRPGDISYDLKYIEYNEHVIVFNFGGSSVVVEHPQGIVVNKLVIAIKSASKVSWNWSEDEIMTYSDNEEKLETSSTNKNHNFNTSKKLPAFLFSTWDDG